MAAAGYLLDRDPQVTSPGRAACRFCGTPLRHVFADLGATPLANSYLRPEQLSQVELHYPLRVFVCERCLLVQLESFAAPELIFSNYAYFSSYSDTLLHHSKAYADMISDRLELGAGDRVVEIGSNDGYLLQYFQEKGLTVLGIEPAANIAEVAVRKGIPTEVRFFGSEAAHELAAEGRRARLLVVNNVLAHVPALNDFVAGLKILLQPRGVVTLEFHHLLSLIANRQFDTIYHEHVQYFSLATARDVLAAHGLMVFDAEELSTQGGSLRIYACHQGDFRGRLSINAAGILAKEEAAGLSNIECYLSFSERVKELKLHLLSFLVDARRAGKSVVCYGAAAKGNTLLNYAGVRADLVDYAVDRSPHKQGLYLPGSRIPICHPDKVKETRADYLLILPWNLQEEIVEQMSHIRAWGGRFVVPIPELKVLP
jgi:SAM-dependent methyltransferase